MEHRALFTFLRKRKETRASFPAFSFLAVKRKVADPMKTAAVEQEVVQFELAEFGLDLFAVHFAAEQDHAGRRLVRLDDEVGFPGRLMPSQMHCPLRARFSHSLDERILTITKWIGMTSI
ncbi:MAG TPA: hypothetical protein VF532_05450 [Candidatus Angelobacter sp.]